MNQFPISWMSYRGRVFQSKEHALWWCFLEYLGCESDYKPIDFYYTFPTNVEEYTPRRTGRGRMFSPLFHVRGLGYLDARPENDNSVDEPTLGKMLAQEKGEPVYIIKGLPTIPTRREITNPVTSCHPDGPIRFSDRLYHNGLRLCIGRPVNTYDIYGRAMGQAMWDAEQLAIGLNVK